MFSIITILKTDIFFSTPYKKRTNKKKVVARFLQTTTLDSNENNYLYKQ